MPAAISLYRTVHQRPADGPRPPRTRVVLEVDAWVPAQLIFGDELDDGASLRVRTALLRMKGRLELVEPKTLRSRRTIALPDVMVAALRTHRVRQIEERLAAGPDWKDWGLVFTSPTGAPLHRGAVLRELRGHLDKAGLPAMRFHDLRHSCASLLAAQGVHPRVAMEILGHSTIALTMDVYSHVLPDLQREAARSMDEALGATARA